MPHATDQEVASIVEFDPRVQAPPRSEWHYTARPRWSSAGESLWMRLSKFSLCNRMGVAELGRLFTRQDEPASRAALDLRCHARWDLDALAKVMEIAADEAIDAFCTTQPRASVSQSALHLRSCPACLATGFHAAWFQWRHVERCPLHNLPLQRGCPQCGQSIPYVLGSSLAMSPLRCTRCGCDWVPSLARPGGSCVPLSTSAAALMRKWAHFARDVVSAEDHPRDLRTGQYAGKKRAPHSSGRPHLLTMVNRLFDSPPPPLADLTGSASSRNARTLVDSSTLLSDAAGHSVGYNSLNWPHFDVDTSFPRLERIVRAARSRLFARNGDQLVGKRWHKILIDDLVMPSGDAPQGVAAAMGWAVSWFGSSQAVTPFAADAAPAFGLAAWLAHLPLRPPDFHPKRWQDLEMNWLLEDLELSARAWETLAEFMGQQRFYLLHGKAVNLTTLARQRTVHMM